MPHCPCPAAVAVADRHLIDQDKRPFFWLADTAWELVHRLDPAELEHYVDTRARQGFNVVQLVLLAELDGLRVANRRGDLPLHDQDPTRPNEAYFEYVDTAVRLLNERGMVACLLPTWGDKFNLKWGKGPVIFTQPGPAEAYGRWLGRRYRDAAAVWMLGGDRPCETAAHRRVNEAMAHGLKEGHGGTQLHSYHPPGGMTSVDAIGDDPDWIDFHAVQSGHIPEDWPDPLVARGRSQTTKPVLESEPAYEGHPRMNRDWSDRDGVFRPAEVRGRLWRAVLAGSPGVTYGCHAVWQMHDPARGTEPVNHPPGGWREALTLPVAEQVHLLRQTLEPLPWTGLRPVEPGVAASADGTLRVSYHADGLPPNSTGRVVDPSAGTGPDRVLIQQRADAAG
jgi:hypothetical protein